MLILLRWLSRRSLRSLHALGAWLGWTIYLFSPDYRRRVLRNAARAGVSVAQRRQSVAEAGKMATEGLRLWLRPVGEPIADPVHWEGEQLIDEALALSRGLVFLTPHMGSFETTAQAYAQRFGARQPITVLFRPARYRTLRELQEMARTRPALSTAPATLGGVRQMLRALRRGEAVGLLPDQVPPDGMGVWADFFGRPAYTMTLAARLALQTGAPILLAWCERLPAGGGFVLRLSRLAEPLPRRVADLSARQRDADASASRARALAQPRDDAAALQQAQAEVINRAMEVLILQCPQQYLWGYHRYKGPRQASADAALAAEADAP